MLTKAEINKIVRYLEGDGTLYELDEVRSEAKSIAEEYIRIVMESLNEEEIKFIELVKNNPEKWEPVFYKSLEICLLYKDGEQIKSTISYNDPEYYTYHFYGLEKNLGEEGKYIPNIFNVYVDVWPQFSIKFPGEWENKIKPKLIRLNMLLNSYSNKVKLLGEILRYDGVNLTLLKSKYPKFYTILKQ